jgi:hypothetical protein
LGKGDEWEMIYQVQLKKDLKYKGGKHKIGDIIDVSRKDIICFGGACRVIKKIYEEEPMQIILAAPPAEKQEVLKRINNPDPAKTAEKVYNKLVDWLLYNLDEIKQYIKEMEILQSTIVYSICPGGQEIDPIEKNIVAVEDAKQIVSSVETSIKNFDSDLFDIYMDRYQNDMLYDRIAEFEEVSIITVKRAIKSIREAAIDDFNNNEISMNEVLLFRKKLWTIEHKKAS